MIELDTKIDSRCRSGCLTGVVKPGEHYHVQRISPVEIKMVLLEKATLDKPRVGKSRNGLTILTGGRSLTAEDVRRELEEFP